MAQRSSPQAMPKRSRHSPRHIAWRYRSAIGVITKLCPQPIDQKVDVAIGRAGAPRGDLVEQAAAAHETTRVAGEGEQQGPLVPGELYRLAVPAREEAGLVEDHVSEAQIFCFAHCLIPINSAKAPDQSAFALK